MHTIIAPNNCDKSCSYCNWKTKHVSDVFDEKRLSSFIRESNGVITISGGGDPLHKANKEWLESVLEVIPYNVKIRVITRKLNNIESYVNRVDFFSISLDSENIYKVSNLKVPHGFSLVLPPFKDFEKYVPFYENLRKSLDAPLILREHACTLFDTDFIALRGFRVISNFQCWQNKYFINNNVLHGTELFENYHGLLRYLSEVGLVFGSTVRHLLNPETNPLPQDIDVADFNGDLFKELDRDYELNNRIHKGGIYYSILKPRRMLGPTIHVCEFESHPKALKWIDSAQLNIDRIYYHHGSVMGLTNETRESLERKIAYKKPNAREVEKVVEDRYFRSLEKKGWKIL